jgi:hypothetical protein
MSLFDVREQNKLNRMNYYGTNFVKITQGTRPLHSPIFRRADVFRVQGFLVEDLEVNRRKSGQTLLSGMCAFRCWGIALSVSGGQLGIRLIVWCMGGCVGVLCSVRSLYGTSGLVHQKEQYVNYF